MPAGKPIPVHLLGNLWGQQWGNVYDLVAPPGGGRGYDLTELLAKKKVDAKGLVRYGEGFFTSLGVAPLPQSFWERSQFVKPADRDVVCHASAWDIDFVDDLRLKMCIQVNDVDFVSPTVGYVLDDGGRLYRTSNGGRNWTEMLGLGAGAAAGGAALGSATIDGTVNPDPGGAGGSIAGAAVVGCGTSASSGVDAVDAVDASAGDISAWRSRRRRRRRDSFPPAASLTASISARSAVSHTCAGSSGTAASAGR